MKIGEAARASGLSEDTIRFYEKSGVLPAPARAANGYRDYAASHLETLRFAHGLRELRLAPREMAEILTVAHDGTCSDLRSALIDRIAAVVGSLDERITALNATRRELNNLGGALSRMRPSQRRVPGLVRCNCVRLVEH